MLLNDQRKHLAYTLVSLLCVWSHLDCIIAGLSNLKSFVFKTGQKKSEILPIDATRDAGENFSLFNNILTKSLHIQDKNCK